MKICGDFILREMAGDTVLVPVGQTAMRFNGIIILQPVAAVIWQAISEGLEEDGILSRILERFEVEQEEAIQDLQHFLSQLRNAGLII